MWYLLDTGWACGGVRVDDDGRIVEAAPVYRRFLWQRLSDVVAEGDYKAEELFSE